MVIILTHAIIDNLFRFINWGTLALSLPDDLPRVMGIVATALLLVVAVPAIFRKALKIPYETWIKVHRISYFVFPMVLLHSKLLGVTIRFQPLALLLWILSAVLYAAALGYRIFLWIQTRQNPLLVHEVQRTTHDTRSLVLSGKMKDYIPGQFVFLQTKKKGKPSESHPFTLSSSPDDPEYRVSIKAVGDFTSEVIPSVQMGDEVYVEGPYGWFSYIRFPLSYSLVFVAGGIGITPFLSMLTFLSIQDPERKVRLLWGNKTERDVGFQEELEGILGRMPNLEVHYLFSGVDSVASISVPGGSSDRIKVSTGFVNPEVLSQGVSSWAQTGLMVCGPPVMMDMISNQAKDLGIPKKHLILEKFSL